MFIVGMSGQAQVQKRYDQLYADVKSFFEDSTSGKLTVASVTTLTRYSMELVQTGESWQGMKGTEKKDLVLGVVTALVEDLVEDPDVVGKNFDEETKQGILALLASVPLIIDMAVDFGKVYHDSQPDKDPLLGDQSQQRSGFFCCF